MEKGFKKLFAAGLAMLMAVSLAACGGDDKEKGGGDKAAAGDSFVYVPEYVSLGDENVRLSRVICSDGMLYYNGYIFDEETYTSRNPIYKYDVAAGSQEEINVDMEGLEDAYVSQLATDKEGNLYIIWVRSVWDENNPDDWHQDTFLAKYDISGNTVFQQDITQEMNSDDENTYIQNMAVDGEGRVYLVCSRTIRLFDGDGSYRGDVETEDSWINDAVRGRDGKVYIIYYNRNGSSGGYVAAEVDFNGKKLGSTHAMPENVGSLSEGVEKDFLINDRTRLYEYDLTSETWEEVLNWVDCDIMGDYVQLVCPSGDGRLMVVINDWETNNAELAFLKKTKASDVVQKEELVLGCMYMSQDLRATAVAFNKSNEKYRVTIKEYYDRNSDIDRENALTNMLNEITSGKGPDLLALSYDLNVEQLVGKEVLADLNPFLDSSSALSRDSFVESVLKGYTYGDTLVSIPKSFSVSAVAGKTSQVGEKMGWSIQDIMAFSAEHPGAELFEYVNQSMMMEVLMTFNQDAFIDWEKGTCNFDCDEFRQMLEFAASFPEEYNWDGERESTPTLLATGKLLLYSDGISQCQDIQVAEAMFNEPVTYIGFPTTDGSVGCVMNCNEGYCIVDKSKKKDGAWEFIEFYLNRDSGMFSWGFPSLKEKLEEQIADACKVEYVTDQNGEIVLDEDGNPIISGMGGFGWGDWSYTYHPCTEEEIATLRELINVAMPMPTSNSEVLTIIAEEAEPFYKGQKSLDDVVSTIQSRMSMYVGENS